MVFSVGHGSRQIWNRLTAVEVRFFEMYRRINHKREDLKITILERKGINNRIRWY
jgi:hypothetical protein